MLTSQAGIPHTRRAPLATPSAPPAAARVLIVEDDRGLLEAYTDVLLEHGFDVAAAADAPAALRALAAIPFDAVLSDVVRPAPPAWTSCERSASATSRSRWCW
jgi:DNA-binding response OmpR family regulator